MSIADREQILRDTPDLAGVDGASLHALAQIAVRKSFTAGQTIAADDAESTALYVIARGLVSVTSRSEHRRAPVEIILGRGGLFGEDLIAHTGMMGATAYRSSDLLILDAREVRAAAARHPALRRVLDRLATIQRDAPWIVDHLRRAPILSRVAPSGIHALLEGAEIIDKKAGERIFDAQSDLGGLALVLSGEAHLKPAGVPLRPVVLGAGAVFGDEGILEQQPFGYDVYAGEDGCRVLRVLEQAFRAQIARSAAFRRAVAASREETARAHGAGAIGREDLALLLRSNWVALVGDDASLPLSTLTDWLAESAHTVWRDDVLVVHLDPSAPDPAPPPVVRDGIRHARLRPQGRPSAALVQACIRADMVLIDFGKVDAASERRLLRLVSRTVYVASTPYVDVPSRLLEAVTRPLLYTAVVPSPAPRPGEPRRVPRGAVRISRTLLDAARAGTARAALPARLQDQLDRWTRAVTERRVGLALGGGGALAFAHIALIQRVHERGLPVDMVAGVSGGSVIGAYYAAGEQLPLDPAGPIPQGLERWPGLVRILHRAGEFSRVCDRGVFFGFQIADWIDAELSSVLLEDLLLPFFPVATDIERAVQVSLRAGPIGFGVRASGALPGPFTPATVRHRELLTWRPLPTRRARALPAYEPGMHEEIRYVDGGVLNNIPDDALYLEGAQIVLASNVVPPPSRRVREQTDTRALVGRALPARVSRLLREADPSLRIDDGLRAGYMMMHSPADWRARAADARFQARTERFTFLDFPHAEAIWRQTSDPDHRDHLDAAVDQLARRYEALRRPKGVASGLPLKPEPAVLEAAQDLFGDYWRHPAGSGSTRVPKPRDA